MRPTQPGTGLARRLLKDRHGAPAMVRFEKALMLAKFLGNKVQERRAVRGLAAAARIQARPCIWMFTAAARVCQCFSLHHCVSML